MEKSHQKHANLARAKFGNFGRNEIAFMGTPCSEIKILFDKIVSRFPKYNFAIVEADHQADEELNVSTSFIDKINFRRFDTKSNPNKFEIRPFFENTDLILVNGNHFEADSQVVIVDSRKTLEKKLHKLTSVALIIQKDEMPQYLIDFFGEKMPPIIHWDDTAQIFEFIESNLTSCRPPIYGLVLAGGKSTRMGTDKSALKYHNQLPQQIFASNLLQKFCGEHVFISKRNDYLEQNNSEISVIEDTFVGLGPMSGLLSAFQKHPNVAWLVVACDLPFLTEKSISQLIEGRNCSKIATTFKSPESDFPEPLITIWEPKAYPKLLQMLAYGYDCPRKVLINSEIEILINGDEKELQNINTPEQYEKAIIDLSPKIA